MSTQRWTDTLIRERVKAKMRNYQKQGAELLAAEAIAYSAVCEDMRNEYEVELASLRELLDNLRTAAHAGSEMTLKALYETASALAKMHAEYKALYDAAIEYINTGSTTLYTSPAEKEAYTALARQAMLSRFWKDNA